MEVLFECTLSLVALLGLETSHKNAFKRQKLNGFQAFTEQKRDIYEELFEHNTFKHYRSKICNDTEGN